MSAGAIRAGAAFVEVTLRDKVTQGLARAQGKLLAFGKAVKAQSVAADAFKGIGIGLAKIGAVLGGAGAGITGIMAKSVSTFMEVSKHAKDIGLSIAGIDASKAENLSNAWSAFKATLGAIQFLIGSAIAEPLTKLLHLFAGAGIEVARFVKAHQELIVAVAAVGAGLVIAGTVVGTLGLAFVAAGAALAGIVAGFAALATPVGIVIALSFGIVAAVTAAGFAFVSLSEVASETVTGIVAALATGNIEAAWNIITNAMSVAWNSVVIAIKTGILEAMKFVSDTVETTVRKLAVAVQVIESSLGAISGRAINLGSASLHQAAASIGIAGNVGQAAIGASFGTPEANLAKGLGGLAAGAGGAKAEFSDKFNKLLLSLRLGGEGLSGKVADMGRGSSQGTFRGSGASLFGVGPGGGQKVSDDATHKKLEDVIKAIGAIEVGVKFS